MAIPAKASKSKVAVRGFKTSRKQIRNRGDKLTSTVIQFRLSEPAVLLFVFRGPGPSCKVSARLSAVGLAGLNRFRFHGYIGKRPFAPGTYLMTLRTKGSATPLARTHLTIVAPGSPPRRYVRPDCLAEAPVPFDEILTAAPMLGALVGDVLSAPPATAAAETRSTAEPKKAETEAGEALGEQTEERAGVPAIPALDASGDSTGFVELILAPALLALTFAALAILAARRSRRPPAAP